MKDDSRSLDLYLREIREIPILSAAEEVRLNGLIKQGDGGALEELIKANLRFVVSVAKKYYNRGLPLADLIQEGNIGLIEAAKRWDETRGAIFVTHAVWWIRKAILRALAEQTRIIRLPSDRVGILLKIGRIRIRLEQTLGRVPSLDEIAKELGLSEREVSSLLKISNSHLSLDAQLSKLEDGSLMDILENESLPSFDESLLSHSRGITIKEALDSLTPKEAEVINFYFGLNSETPLTLKEIGAKLSLAEGSVSHIKEKALQKLRHTLSSLSPQAW